MSNGEKKIRACGIVSNLFFFKGENVQYESMSEEKARQSGALRVRSSNATHMNTKRNFVGIAIPISTTVRFVFSQMETNRTPVISFLNSLAIDSRYGYGRGLVPLMPIYLIYSSL